MANGDKPPGGNVNVSISEFWKESGDTSSARAESIGIPCHSEAEAKAIYDRVVKAVNEIKAEYADQAHPEDKQEGQKPAE